MSCGTATNDNGEINTKEIKSFFEITVSWAELISAKFGVEEGDAYTIQAFNTLSDGDIANHPASEAGWSANFIANNPTTMDIGLSEPVPEPASFALLALGLAGLGFNRRKAS